MTTVLSQCQRCKHYQGASECAAYPDGIPAQIVQNTHDHREAYPGDNGIQFEPIEEPTT